MGDHWCLLGLFLNTDLHLWITDCHLLIVAAGLLLSSYHGCRWNHIDSFLVADKQLSCHGSIAQALFVERAVRLTVWLLQHSCSGLRCLHHGGDD